MMTSTVSGATINTKKATGRRTVRYESYDELLADAQRLAGTKVHTVGNWSYGQILDHLSKACHGMIDGMDFKIPAPARLMMRLLMKKKMLTQQIPPGFQIPSSVKAAVEPVESISVEKALASFSVAIERCKAESKRSLHPAFGNMTCEEWDLFQLRHCEMHMSFVVPDGD
ncbi:MAG: DUF1569 domain-containing protein [Planctomycetales bacterium]